MSIPTKDRLSAELRAVAKKSNNAEIYLALADRAETGEFDDYGDVHDCGPIVLYNELINAGLTKFARRVANGEFDASFAESEEWARAQTDPFVVALMDLMGTGPDRSGDN